jgi:hypothetical protein
MTDHDLLTQIAGDVRGIAWMAGIGLGFFLCAFTIGAHAVWQKVKQQIRDERRRRGIQG